MLELGFVSSQTLTVEYFGQPYFTPPRVSLTLKAGCLPAPMQGTHLGDPYCKDGLVRVPSVAHSTCHDVNYTMTVTGI
jgi:hypothetical protein